LAKIASVSCHQRHPLRERDSRDPQILRPDPNTLPAQFVELKSRCTVVEDYLTLA
jgi:hypothetical protein